MVGDTRGAGLIGCVEGQIVDSDNPKALEIDIKIGARIDRHCQKLGLIVRPLLNMCVFSPPLIINSKQIMHGKTSKITHDSSEMYIDVSNPFDATRYHSLAIDETSLVTCLKITAWTGNDGEREIMGIRHRNYPVFGLQFHPESILTVSGHQLLKNFLEV